MNLWGDSHPRTRFGGLPASFLVHLHRENRSSSYTSTSNKELEEIVMYRRYLSCLYGDKGVIAHDDALVVPERPLVQGPMTEAESIWKMYEEGAAAQHTEMHENHHHNSWVRPFVAGAGSSLAVAAALARFYRPSGGEVEEIPEEDLHFTPEGGRKPGRGKGVDGWEARIIQTPHWSQLRRFKFVKSLGKGSHAETFLVEKGGLKYALKESEQLQEAINEARLLSQVSSKHVVKLEDFFIESLGHRQVAYLQLEYCDGGDLTTLFRMERARQILDTHNIKDILSQVALGLETLHAKNIIHRDLKPDNVLIGSDGSVKLGDFGVSTKLTASLPNTSNAAGSVPFMAPEVRKFLLGESICYNEKADIWSFGALAYALCVLMPTPNIAHVPPTNVISEVSGPRMIPIYFFWIGGSTR